MAVDTTVAVRATAIITTTKVQAMWMSVVNTAVVVAVAAVATVRDGNTTPTRDTTTNVPLAMVQVVVSTVMAQASKPSINHFPTQQERLFHLGTAFSLYGL